MDLTDISANATERHLTETIKAKRQAMGINPHACRFVFFLTSSLRHPKIFVKEFSDFLMSCH
ncbi:hypothetical protein, partial [uncultured Prevotella sp.]|uniref:hypothetical protein n=1 Tax=uncultured Prevotella sp. TaxID=159272 RepID=UPI00258D53FD